MSDNSQSGWGGKEWLYAFLSGNLWIPLYCQLFFFFFSTQICHCLFCFYLLLSSLSLHHAPYVIVVSVMQSGNYTKKKLKGKRSIFGNLSPVASTLIATSFGFTMWEFARGGEKSQFIQRHQWPLCPSNQPAQLQAEVGASLTSGEGFSSPISSGCVSLQMLISMDSQALHLEVSSSFAAAWGAGKATHSSRALWAWQCC